MWRGQQMMSLPDFLAIYIISNLANLSGYYQMVNNTWAEHCVFYTKPTHRKKWCNNQQNSGLHGACAYNEVMLWNGDSV